MNNWISYIDKVGLEKVIEYHKAEFGIIDGYYYIEGRNNTINHVIKYLYDLRKKLKQYKELHRWLLTCWWIICMAKQLLLNQWGQILLWSVIDMILKSRCSYNYDYIDSVIKVSGKLYIKKVKSILSHVNYVHYGVEILNMSKRIMNKVFSCADECAIKIQFKILIAYI